MRPILLFLVTIDELLAVWLLISVPLVLVWVCFRCFARGKEISQGGCLTRLIRLTLLAGALLGLLAAIEWWERRPVKMLADFLEVEDVSSFRELRSEFIGGMDYTARVYFETDRERMEQLIIDLGFEKTGTDSQGLEMVDFSEAPAPPLSNAVIYRRQKPVGSAIEYLVTTPDHEQGWFVSLDY